MEEYSIREDIKDLEKYINFCSKSNNFSRTEARNFNEKLSNKVKHILLDYKNIKHKLVYISEICVENSKQHIDDRQSIMKIIKILQNKKESEEK